MPRRILVAVSGLSPQIVTETVFALACRTEPAWVPDEIHLLTTTRGADNARLKLLSSAPGWFHRLRSEWALPSIRFDADGIHILEGSDGQPLDDLRDETDHLAAADSIVRWIRELTQDPSTEVHASIAGGRKSMGYYLGHAMSLFGRPQDRLSHVLVSAPYEGHPEFYFPTRETSVIHTLDARRDALDTSKATVWLGDIPFLRLRELLPRDLLTGHATYVQTIASAQAHVEPPSLTLNLQERQAQFGTRTLTLPPAELAFLLWFAERAAAGKPPIRSPKVPDTQCSREYLAAYRRVVPTIDDAGATASRLAAGMDKRFFEERKSKLKRWLTKGLGALQAQPYLIHGSGRPMGYSLGLAPQAIRFSAVAGSDCRAASLPIQ